MKAEPEEIERFARFLCKRAGKDPDELRTGNLAHHSSLDYHQFICGDYDHLFDEGGEYGPDGIKPNTDPAMFKWRDYVEDAIAIREFLKIQSRDADRREWVEHMQTLGPMLQQAKKDGMLDALIESNLWPLPKCAITDADVQQAIEIARRIRPEIEAQKKSS